MKKQIIFSLIFCSIFFNAKSQIVQFENSAANQWTQLYIFPKLVPNKVVGYMKGDSVYLMRQQRVIFTGLGNNRVNRRPNNITWFGDTGEFFRSPLDSLFLKWRNIDSIPDIIIHLSDTLNNYIKYNDTTFILATQYYINQKDYLIPSDTIYLHNQLDSKLNIIDTINKWQPKGNYLNSFDTTGKWLPTGTFIPTNNNQLINGTGFITSYTEIDPLSTHTSDTAAMLANYARVLAFYNKTQSDARYLQLEVDGSITNEIELPSQTGKIGKYLKTNGTIASWDTLHSALPDYFNSSTTTTGVAIFYLTSNKTSGGTALYTDVTSIIPFINDVNTNFTYGYSLSGDKKTLTVTAKYNPVIILLSTSILGSLSNVTNGTIVYITVKGY